MTIWGFDPGSNATGVACLDGDHSFKWGQFEDPIEAWEQLIEFGNKDDIVLIEDYRTAGHLTREAKETLKIVGFLEYSAYYGWGWGQSAPVMRVEQHRLSGRREAAQLMGGTIEELESDKSRKDAFSALAHCCVYRRSLG